MLNDQEYGFSPALVPTASTPVRTEATRRGTGADGRRSPLLGTCHPLADSSYTDAEGLGKLPLGPPLLFEVPGL
jgi:hypothetical protein